MLYTLFTHMDQVSQEAVDAMLPLVSAQRREEALRYRHLFGQFCCLKSYCMLMELLGAVSPTLAYAQPEFVYNEYGKPSLKDRPDLYFSISHTKCAILVAISNRPIGVDVEQIRHPSDGLVERTMNRVEQDLISASRVQHLSHDSHSCPNPDTAFTALWTQKEAVLKLRGTGIVDDLQDVLSAPDSSSCELLRTTLRPDKGLAMTIASSYIGA